MIQTFEFTCKCGCICRFVGEQAEGQKRVADGRCQKCKGNVKHSETEMVDMRCKPEAKL